MFRDPAQIEERRAELNKPHIEPLTQFVRELSRKGFGEVPSFDPWDGGVEAQALFLFEKPGRQADCSGFISRNNDDGTAENTFHFMKQADIPRAATCTWNVVPGWNGTRALTPNELRQGALALPELLARLRRLEVIVLVGGRAQKAWRSLRRLGLRNDLPVIPSAHPSPVVFATAHEQWDAIPSQWAGVKPYLRCCST
jgi:hypothetical protein